MSWTVYSKDGKTVRCVLNKLEYSGTFMGERTVSATLSSDKRIEFNIFDYIEYRGERFEIELLPTVKKISSNNYSYDLRFVSLKYELERCMMRDIVPNDNGIVYPTPLTIEFTGTVRYLAERIQACLDAMYGTGVWSIGIAEGTESEEKSISMSNQNCWDALSLVNTEYKLNYFVKGRNVTIGGSEPVVDNVFEYGKGKGLYEIERISDSDTGVVTKLRAYGGTRNLDYSYPKLPEWEDSVLPTNYALSPLRLMLPSFKTDGKTDYVLASDDAIAQYGIREGVITYDDIYPSITGMKNSAGQAIDEIKSVSAITSDTQPTFTVGLHDLGFDLSESLTTDEAQISMKSGALQGYAFNITKIEKASDGSYTVTLGRNTLEEGDTGNFTVPNKDWNMKSGDKFVLLNILMPQEYIRDAENRLLARAKEYLAKYSVTNYSYNVGVDEIFMARNVNFYNDIMEGKRLTVNDNEIGINNENIIIQSLTIKEGEGIIPTFDVTLNNEITASTLDRIQAQISEVEASVNSKFSSESELSKQYRKKLDKAVFDSVFKLHYDDPDNPNLPTSVESLVGFWTERWMSSMGLNPGTGGGEGGASTLGELSNVGPWADEVPSADRVMVQLKGATHWTSKPLSEIVGLDTEALGNYLTSNNYAKKSDIPSLSGYATEAWVTTKLGSYATASSLKAVSDKLDDFLTGTDTDTVINKWKELEAFLSGFKETDTLAGALALKADKTQLADYVTLGTTQTITANKKFSVDAASVISVDNNAKTSTSDYAAIIFRHGGEHIGGIAANKNDNYLYRASVNFTTSYKILDVGNYTETLDSRYVTKAFFSRLFKAHKADGSDIAVNDTATDIDNIEALFGFWTERWMSSMGLNPGTGGGEGGASTLGELSNVGPWADEVPSADRVMVQLKGATHWTSKPLSEIVGLDTEALGNYLTSNNYAKKSDIPSLSGYATEAWVTTKLGSYATASSLKAVSDKLDDFLTGTDTDTVINKWKELEAFLSGFKETDTLAGALALKADKTQLADYVTLGTTQTITANKKFSVDAASVISVDNNAKTSTSDYAAIIFRHGGEHIGGIAANKNDNYLYRASVNFTTSYKILDAGNYTETLDNRYVKKSGDTMTGVLQFSGALNVKHHNYGISTYAATGSSWEGGYKYYNTAGSAQLGAFGAYGSSNSLNFLYIGKSYEDTWLKVTGGAVVPLEVRSSNATGQVIQVCDASGTGAELGWYTGLGAFIQNDRLSSRPTLSLGGVDSLDSGIRFRYSGNYYDVWHGGNYLNSKNEIFNNQLSISLVGYDENKWYPCWFPAYTYDGTPTRLVIFSALRGNKPSWGTHQSGISLYLDVECIGGGWGNITGFMNCNHYTANFGGETALGGAEQNSMGSVWLVYLRGGTVYYYWLSNNRKLTTSQSGYSWTFGSYSFSRSPKTSQGSPLSGIYEYATTNSNVASATKLQTARSLWGQSFDGTGNVSGSMSGVGTITPLSNNAYTLGTNGVRFSNAFVTSWIYAGAGMYMDGPAVTRNNSFVELSNGGNEMVVSSGAASDIHINYRAPGFSGRKAPATWYWRAGSSSSWANFNLGSLTANGNISATGLLNAPRIMTAAIRIECDNTGALNGHGSEINNFNSHLYLQHHSGTNLVCCNGGGKAGIGTASPSYKLHVVGDVYANGGWLRSSGATGWYNETYGGGWYMADGTYLRPYNSKIIYSSSGILAAYSAGSWISMAQRTTCIYADNNNSASSAHALFRTKWNNGNAMCYGGLGDEMGFYAFPKSYIDNSNNSYSWKTVWSSSGTLTHYGTFRATVGMWTDGYASAMGSNTSDIRLKTNIRDFNATEIIRKLRPVAFEWNNMAKQRSRVFDTEDTQYGLVAQEVKAVTPWAAVDNMFGDGYMGVRYEKYIPVLLKAQIEFLDCLSEEQKKIRELERKLANVEKENRELLEFKRKVEQRLSA